MPTQSKHNTPSRRTARPLSSAVKGARFGLTAADYPRLHAAYVRVKAARVPGHWQLLLDQIWFGAYQTHFPKSRRKLLPYPPATGEAWLDVAQHNRYFAQRLTRLLPAGEAQVLRDREQTELRRLVACHQGRCARQLDVLERLLDHLAPTADLAARSVTRVADTRDEHSYRSQTQPAAYARGMLEARAAWLHQHGFAARVDERTEHYTVPYAFSVRHWDLVTDCAAWQEDALERSGRGQSLADVADHAWARGLNPLVWYPTDGRTADALGLSWDSYQRRRVSRSSEPHNVTNP